MKKNKLGAFTLLELLVVIAIMGILISLGVASFSNAQRKSRDSRRREDLKAVQNGLEQHYADNGHYRVAAGATTGRYELSTLFNNLINSSQYFPAGPPVDPKNSGEQRYRSSWNKDNYCICVELETAGAGNASAGSTAITCSYSLGGDYFCVSNLQ